MVNSEIFKHFFIYARTYFPWEILGKAKGGTCIHVFLYQNLTSYVTEITHRFILAQVMTIPTAYG